MTKHGGARPGKGGAAPPDEPEFLGYVRDQLRRWGPVEIRRMFSGHGIFRGDLMFALINADILYLRTDDSNRGKFLAAGMSSFSFTREGKSVPTRYYEVPAEVLDDQEHLAQWAAQSFVAAQRYAQTKIRKKRG